MPDAHWGYGFPIGGVAAFDADHDGVVSAGGVGFDISCGVRTLHTGLTADELGPFTEALADQLARRIPAGMGSTGQLHLDEPEIDAMLSGGIRPFVTSRDAGTGLGLAIVKRFARDLGGELAIANRVPRGACVTLSLPAVREDVRHAIANRG